MYLLYIIMAVIVLNMLYKNAIRYKTYNKSILIFSAQNDINSALVGFWN